MLKHLVRPSTTLAEPGVVMRLNTLFVKAEESEVPGIWLLVAFVEVEIFGNEDDCEGEDFTEPGKEVYRLPFPFDLQTRKAVLRLLREQPSFHLG